jgi:hypothetical protein
MTDAQVEAACATLKRAIEAAENANQAGEDFVMAAAAGPALLEALISLRDFGCPVCSGDCGSANPPVSCCPMTQASTAIAKAKGSAQ